MLQEWPKWMEDLEAAGWSLQFDSADYPPSNRVPTPQSRRYYHWAWLGGVNNYHDLDLSSTTMEFDSADPRQPQICVVDTLSPN